jgi:hypothetical protein
VHRAEIRVERQLTGDGAGQRERAVPARHVKEPRPDEDDGEEAAEIGDGARGGNEGSVAPEGS